jgi:hypothetical protein
MGAPLLRAQVAILVMGLALVVLGSVGARRAGTIADLRLDRQDQPSRVSFHSSSSKLPAHRLGLRKSSEPVKPLLVVPATAVAALEAQPDEQGTPATLAVHDSSLVHHAPRAPPAIALVSYIDHL